MTQQNFPQCPPMLSVRHYDALQRYVVNRIPTGGFLHAVLCNDLIDTIGRADSESMRELQEIITFLFNEVRQDCYGSPEKVTRWLDRELQQRTEEVVPGEGIFTTQVAPVFEYAMESSTWEAQETK